MLLVLFPLLIATSSGAATFSAVDLGRTAAVPGAGTRAWPVVGPVIGPFEPPETPFGSGHRGIDIAAPFGTMVVAAETGVVAFAGPVGGELFVTLDHGGGLTSTYSWLSERLVARGDVVARGAVIARSGRGHPGSSTPHLHFGVRLDGEYLDPMTFLGPLSVSEFIRLAPLGSAA
ncbi:MAG TPA: M23 family metallopeptidase [Actinomycetota bacterium]|nr:M23 family metallopeptidase [Actinomycetota bacterium]